MGWLHAPLTIKVPGSDDITENRVSQYSGDDLACSMPPADQFIVNQFHQLGFNLNTGSGAYPITWAELSSYSLLRSAPLTEWESESLIAMSREYCSWMIKAKDKHFISPWHHEDYDPIAANRLKVERQVKAMKEARKNMKTA